MEQVKTSQIEDLTMEGVVGKYGDHDKFRVIKCKTQKWLDAIKNTYSAEQAKILINS